MADQLCPKKNNLFPTGNFNFTMEEVQIIYAMYAGDKLSLWQVQEAALPTSTIHEIAVAVSHVIMDIQKVPYYQRPSYSCDPNFINLAEFRVGHPSRW